MIGVCGSRLKSYNDALILYKGSKSMAAVSTTICDEKLNPLWGDDWLTVKQRWSLDYSVFQFSHGAYGGCPNSVREMQLALLERMHRNPTGFFRRELLPLLEEARHRAAQFCSADAKNIAWVRNATDGMTVAINALPLEAGEEIVITNHIYEAVKIAVERRARETGAKIVQAHVPLTDDDNVLIAAIESKLTKKTRALIIDDIASPTARVFPVREIAKIARDRNIPIVVDAAHAPGMYPLAVEQDGVDMWVGNFHKWVCAPYVAGVLWVAPKWHDKVQPLSASFRDNLPYPQNFGRLGTDDLTAALCVPHAIDFLEELGASKVREYSCKLAAIGAETITKALGTRRVPGKFAARHPIALPEGIAITDAEAYTMQTRIGRELGAELSVAGPVSHENHGYLLISSFVYNHPNEYQRFAEQFVPWLMEAYRTP
jgi:isopenicillin-N epimerase